MVGRTFLLRASHFGGRVYDVVIVPEDTLVLPESERCIPMPD